jgi:2-polyprenyl-6-methoxyphenol hydroxylase-like FAD-dependent oxidoreductase
VGENDMRVVIIGAGIAGLTTAVALQGRGIEAQVYESASELHLVGKGIWVPTNAMLVLDRLALGDAVAKHGIALSRAEGRVKDGGVLQSIDLDDIQKRFGRTTVSILRADLQTVLANALREGSLHLGKHCVGVSELSDGAVVAFDDGTTAEADVVIGADGIHSVMRKAVAENVTLRYAGQTCYLGISQLQLPTNLARTSWEVCGGAKRFGFSPVTEELVYWFAPITASEASPLLAGDLTVPLQETYSDFPDPILRIIQHTPPAEIIRVDLYDFPPIERWHRGRVVLAGDAAHAMTPNLGQGGAQAIEDAYVLAAALTEEDTIAAAFQVYQRLRQPKARRIVNLSRRFGQLAHVEAPWAMRLRNVVLRSIPPGISRRQTETLYELNY